MHLSRFKIRSFIMAVGIIGALGVNAPSAEAVPVVLFDGSGVPEDQGWSVLTSLGNGNLCCGGTVPPGSLTITPQFGGGLNDVLNMNHPFEQGNKRTGATASLMFLEANGYEWSLIDNGEFGMWVLDMVNNQISESDLAELMRPYVK